MTCAAFHAAALDEHLTRVGPDGDSGRYLRAVDRVTNAAWSLSVAEDFRLPTTRGRRPPGTRAVHWYGSRYSRACLSDAELHARFLEVASMRKSPAALMYPSSLVRVARHRRTPQPTA